MDTITDPYFIAAVKGKELPSGMLLVQPKDGDNAWEEWHPCGQLPGEAEDRLYKSKWYRKGRTGSFVELGGGE